MKITRQLKPFTHRMGTLIAMPGARFALRVFPARLEIVGGEGADQPIVDQPIVDLPIHGPIGDFTAIQDLERGGIHVSLRCQEGLIRYTALPGEDQPVVLALKKGEIELPWQGRALAIQMPEERLFFGSHKKLDWTLVQRRCDPRELLPIWHRLGLALQGTYEEVGPSLLSEACDLSSIMALFRAGFAGLMAPCRVDPLHQGFSLPPLRGQDPFALLALGAQKIASLALVNVFPSGSHCNQPHPLGILSYEWTKHRLRTVSLVCTTSGAFSLPLPKAIKRFRAKRERRILDASYSYPVSEGETYLFDRFENP